MNSVTGEILGDTAVVKEDLSNIVDLGKSILDATDIDTYVKKLVDKIGKVVFQDRKYSGSVPSVFMDGWEFGSVMQKITADLPDAKENPSWDLKDGQSYDVNIFYQPKVDNKFYNSKVSFEIPLSFTERQVKSSFNSPTELNAFLSMLVTTVENSITVKVDALIMRTINTMIIKTVKAEYPTGTDYSDSKVKVINLLKIYNDMAGSTITASECMANMDFMRFATYYINLHAERMAKMSKLFNVGKKARFTPRNKLVTVLLSDFKMSSDTLAINPLLNKNENHLPSADLVPYWQGSGTGYEFGEISKVSIEHSGDVIEISGIVGVMFDRDALGVTNLNKRVTTNYNAQGEFYNNYYKFDAGYFNDLNENFIVFTVIDAPAGTPATGGGSSKR